MAPKSVSGEVVLEYFNIFNIFTFLFGFSFEFFYIFAYEKNS